MARIKDRLDAALTSWRARHPHVDHAIRTQEHYGATKAGQQAGAVTYFGFLSVFPVLALAFFAVGYVSRVFPGAQDALTTAITEMFPNLDLDLTQIEESAATVGLIGLAGVLYAGLGWLSALRTALAAVFALAEDEQLGFVAGKLRDLAALVVLGSILLVSVVATGLIAGFSADVLDAVGLDDDLTWVVQILSVAAGLLANVALFFAMFRLLAAPPLPKRALASGAVLGAAGFEVLKVLSRVLIDVTQGNPAFQVFGLALILLVWINYFSRLTLYAAAWAVTDPTAAR